MARCRSRRPRPSGRCSLSNWPGQSAPSSERSSLSCTIPIPLDSGSFQRYIDPGVANYPEKDVKMTIGKIMILLSADNTPVVILDLNLVCFQARLLLLFLYISFTYSCSACYSFSDFFRAILLSIVSVPSELFCGECFRLFYLGCVYLVDDDQDWVRGGSLNVLRCDNKKSIPRGNGCTLATHFCASSFISFWVLCRVRSHRRSRDYPFDFYRLPWPTCTTTDTY